MDQEQIPVLVGALSLVYCVYALGILIREGVLTEERLPYQIRKTDVSVLVHGHSSCKSFQVGIMFFFNPTSNLYQSHLFLFHGIHLSFRRKTCGPPR